MVWSTKWGTNIRNKNREYYVEYHTLLPKNYKENQLSNLTEIKNDFLVGAKW